MNILDINHPDLLLIVSRLIALKGESVRIDWHDQCEADWPNFKVLEIDLGKHSVCLQGEDWTEVGDHEHDEFWCPIADIKAINRRN